MEIKQRVPKQFRMPMGLVSIGIAMLGVTIGYIFVMFGIMLLFDMTTIKDGMTQTESIIVIGTGILTLVVGYLGWRGFNHFAY